MTPEGKVKAHVTRTLKKFEGLYYYMPVPSGYGPSSLDYLVCFKGMFVGIETKAPGKKPTPRQDLTIRNIEDAGGKVFIIDGGSGQVRELEDYLEGLL